MIFSELYSVYYSTVSKILEKALQSPLSDGDLQDIVMQNAFSESVLQIIPALKSGKWQLLGLDNRPVICHSPSMPLTMLEKQWLKALSDDPRLRLFETELPSLEGVEPLFTREDYRVYDQFADGDPFENESYIAHFRLLRQAILEKRPVKVTMNNRMNHRVTLRFYPKGFEYSLKDDKLRVLVSGCGYTHINLGRVLTCIFYEGSGPWKPTYRPMRKREVLLEITDERNALERVMLHFAHFEKQAQQVGERTYRLRLHYYESDEMELVIRILSFGPRVKVLQPDAFVERIKERLLAQKMLSIR